MILKKVIFLFLLLPITIYGQNRYLKQYNNLPVSIKKKYYLDDNNLSKSNLKIFFETDSLDISGLTIENIEFIDYFKNLTILNASDNEIIEIPQKIDVYNYKEINLSNNPISYTKITELKFNYKRREFVYDFDSTKTPVIYDFVPAKIKLKADHYYWWQNLSFEIKTILEENANIYIEDFNDIQPTELEKIINLEILVVANQNIEDLLFISELQNLVILDCSKNIITDLTPVYDLQKLGVLICNSNQINNLSGIEKLTELEVLDISENDISDIKNITNLKNLEYLDVSKNDISEIKNISKIQSLEFVNIAYNSIDDISELSEIETLNKIYCSEIDKKEIKAFKNNNKNKEIEMFGNNNKALYLSIFSLIFSASLFTVSFL